METSWPFLLKDLGAFFIVNLCLLLSAFGSSRLLRPLLQPKDFLSQSLALSFSVMIVASVFFMIILAHSPISVIGVLAVFFGVLQLCGVYELFANRREWASYLRMHRNLLVPFAILFFVSMIFWAWILRDVAGFTSQADGIAHTNWFLRIIDSGNLLLPRTPMAFPEEFGLQTMSYYPTGVHGLMAAYFGWMISIGLFSGAQILKACMLAGGVWTLPMLLASIHPFFEGRYKTVIIWIAGLAALSWIPFPTTMIDNGGINRLIAYVISFPLILALVRKYDDDRYVKVALAVAVSGVFMMHPGPSGLLGIAFAYSSLLLLFEKGRGWGLRIKEIVLRTGCFIVGAAPILYVIANNKATDLINELRMQGTYWDRVGWRLKVLFEGTLQPDTLRSSFYFDMRLVLFLVALAVLFLPTRIAHMKLRFRLFALFSMVSVVAILLSSYTEFKILRLMGTIYYGDQLRMRDVLFPGFAMFWGMGAAGMLLAWDKLRASRLSLRGPLLYALGAFALVFAVDSTQRGLILIRKYIEKQNIAYNSPRYSQNEGIIELIRQNAEKDAMIIAPPFFLDSVEARTGRKSVWVFLQCFAIESTDACKKREALIGETSETLKVLAERTNGVTSPLPDKLFTYLEQYRRPIYIAEVAVRPFQEGQRLTSDIEVVGSASGMMLYRFIRESQKSAEN